MREKKSSSNKFYITTSIAYTNAPPHCGFALEVIQADVIARYHRSLGENVFFLTGTDEHGAKIEKKAVELGKTPEEFCQGISKRFQELRGILNLSNDDFIRTSDKKRHWPTVKKIWLKLKERGDIYKKRYKGLYCVGCEAFVKEKDLLDGKCPFHQRPPEIIEEENYFFRLSRYQKEIRRILEREEIKIVPQTRKNEILSFLDQEIEDISCSRCRENLKWGIPVPDDNTQTIYVWFDALINYLSALDYAKEGEKFKKYWPPDVHCLGKDILRFHALLWPAILISAGLPLPKTIFVHGLITSGGKKMSKSLGNVIDPFELVNKYGTDPVRYFLLREIPPTEDGDFTYEKFEKRYNDDLAKGLGNLAARVLTMAEKKCKTQNAKCKITIQDAKLKMFLEKVWLKYHQSLKDFKFNEALSAVWQLISFCDKYIEETRPWEESENQLLAINNLLLGLGNIARMLYPFLPETSEKIFQQLGINPKESEWCFKIKKAAPLFPRIK